MKKPKIEVLLSAYNGEEYIEEQINSILDQTDVDVFLLIRDDGSTDSTPEILKQIEKKSVNVKCSFEKNIGVKNSFLKLISMSDKNFDYYALSDQDDIWEKNKLIAAVEKLKKENNEIPLVYGSAVSLFCEGMVTGIQFVNPDLHFGNFLIKNYFPGCTTVFNPSMRQLINITDYHELSSYPLHDHWINLVCTACGGKVITDKKAYILYRQHGDNAVGDRNIRQKIRQNGLIGQSTHIRYNIACELNRYYLSKEKDQTHQMLQEIINYRNSLKDTLKLAFDKRIKPVSKIEGIVIFLNVILRKF